MSSFEGRAELALELELADDTPSHAGAEDLRRAPVTALDLVHRDVRVAHQLVGGGALAADRDADRGGDDELAALDRKRLLEELVDAIRHSLCILRPGDAVEEDRELVTPEPGDRVARPHARHQAPRERDEQLIADGVAVGVVDELEAIQVEEQDRASIFRDTAAAPQRELEVIEEHGSVGQPGQRIVQGVVDEPLLGALTARDVRDRAGDPDRPALAIANRDATGEHPAVGAVRVHRAMLAGQVGRLALDVALDLMLELWQVVGVDPVEPLRGRVADVLVLASEEGLPPLRVVDRPGLEVPVPDAVVGAPDGEGVAVLSALELPEDGVMPERVPDRTLEHRRGELALEQEVGNAEHVRLEVDLVVVEAGEHDHGRRALAAERLPDEVEAGAVTEPMVDEVDVVLVCADPLDGLGEARGELDVEVGPILSPEVIAGEEEVLLVVLDDENSHRSRFDTLSAPGQIHRTHPSPRSATRRSRTSSARRPAKHRPGRRR